jgi:hypothetical protein
VGFLRLTQLGVNNSNAIWNGALAGNVKFFGTATAEVVGGADQYGSWNGDRANSVISSSPWVNRGGRSGNSSGSGVFALHRDPGQDSDPIGHRTILSGY